MTDTTTRTAEDMVSEADTGARDAGPGIARLIFWISILWSLFQLYIASKVPGMIAELMVHSRADVPYVVRREIGQQDVGPARATAEPSKQGVSAASQQT